MAWEHGRYYTRTARVGGRRARKYVGCDALAILVAKADDERRRQRQAERAARRALLEELAALDRQAAELDRIADAVFRAGLAAGGFHEHKGQWRKRRAPRDAASPDA